ncbi:MAG: hypothetical protein E7172_00210 [Firmicutes bacterium]|nr:hypothetical protein [Bacillota bacterium]
MNKLPKVFVNPIEKKINNYQESFYGNLRKERKVNYNDLIKKINEIFASKNHVYKSKVKITLKDNVVEEIIVGKTNANILTIDGKLISINEIIDIEKI